MQTRDGVSVLTPVRIPRADAVRTKLAELALTGADIENAVEWARSRVAEPSAEYKAKPATKLRKAAKRKARDERRQQASIQHQAMLSGDEKHLPVRDRGPVRRYIRDFVDARWNIGEWLLPIMLIVLIISYTQPNTWTLSFTLVLYLLVVFAIGDALLTCRRIKKLLSTKYEPSELSGGGFYTFMRSFQLRRWRMPRPQVKRGEYPTL